MRSTLFCLISVSALALASLQGCGPRTVEYNSNSGPDGVRDTATQLYLNTSDDDRCNAETGDHEDWRVMHIEQTGLLRVSVRIDNPRVDADVFLHDGYGRPIDRLNINESSDFYEFSELEVPVGRYYFRIACNKGESVYTVSAAFREPEKVAEQTAIYTVEAAPEPEPEPRPKRRREKKPEPEPEPKPEPKVEKKPEPKPEPVPVEPEPAAPPQKVTGDITLVTPSDGGKAKITIRGVGSKYGIDASMKGKLRGKGKTVTLFDCSSTKCQGIVEADEEELKEFNKVEFLVPAQ